LRCPPTSPLFPYTTLFRSRARDGQGIADDLLEVQTDEGFLRPEARELLDAPYRLRATRRRFLDDVESAADHVRVGGILPHQLRRSEEHTSELQSLTNLVCR